MTVVSSDILQGVLTNFRALFEKDFAAAQNAQQWGDLAVWMDSNGELNTYEWFGTVPKMQDVSHDSVEIGDLTEYNFSITNKEFQAAIEVSRTAIERDRLNLITPRISQLADEAARHPCELIYDLFEANPDAFDGDAFFANSHTVATFDNLLAGNGADSVAHFQTDLSAARTAMRLFPDDKGRPMNRMGNMLVIPAQIEQIAWNALNPGASALDRPVMNGGSGQKWSAAGYDVFVNPYLTDANDWYMLYNGGPMARPFIYQVEKKPVLESDTNPNSREAIIQRNYLYSVYGRYNVGVTDPRFGVKVVNS